jgi:hypothetical protein
MVIVKGRHKFGRICQRFWLTPRLRFAAFAISIVYPGDAMCFRVGILCRQKKEHDV